MSVGGMWCREMETASYLKTCLAFRCACWSAGRAAEERDALDEEEKGVQDEGPPRGKLD